MHSGSWGGMIPMTVYFSTAVRLSQTYIVTEDLSVAAESLPPEEIAQQNDVLMPWPVLIVREQAPVKRIGSEHRKETPRDAFLHQSTRPTVSITRITTPIISQGRDLEISVAMPTYRDKSLSGTGSDYSRIADRRRIVAGLSNSGLP
jgi:hypothetical protein